MHVVPLREQLVGGVRSALMVLLVPRDRPEGMGAERRMREQFVAVGATAFLDVIDRELASRLTAPRGMGVRSATPTLEASAG